MNDEELPFVSSSPLLATQQKKVKPQDERDLPTLKKVQTLLEQRIGEYEKIDRLTVSEETFTVQQQLAINQAIKYHLEEIKRIIDSTISNIKEKYE